MLECSRRDVATTLLQVERSASRSLLGVLAIKGYLGLCKQRTHTYIHTWCSKSGDATLIHLSQRLTVHNPVGTNCGSSFWPLLVGWRPSLLGWRPLLLGLRLLGGSPLRYVLRCGGDVGRAAPLVVGQSTAGGHVLPSAGHGHQGCRLH